MAPFITSWIWRGRAPGKRRISLDAGVTNTWRSAFPNAVFAKAVAAPRISRVVAADRVSLRRAKRLGGEVAPAGRQRFRDRGEVDNGDHHRDVANLRT